MEPPFLPPEVHRNILLSLPFKELPIVCQTNRDYYSICSSNHFWKEYFLRHDLPILEAGVNFSSWYNLFIASRQAMSLANIRARFLIEGPSELELALDKVEDPSIIEVDGIDPQVIQEYLDLSRVGGEYEEALRELEEFDEEYADIIADAHVSGETSPELQNILEIRDELESIVEATPQEQSFLFLYQGEGEKVVYELSAGQRRKVILLPPEELLILLYRLYFYNLI